LTFARASRAAWGVAGLVLFVIAWEVAAAYIASVNPRAEQIFPSWAHILTTSVRELEAFVPFGDTSTGYAAAADVLAHHSLVTLRRVVIGTLAGIAIGVAVGLAMAYSRFLFHLLNPIMGLIRTIPLLALIPLFVLWFSGREVGVVLFIGFAVFVMIFIATYHAADNVARAPKRFARTMGATKATMFRTVVIPGMLPELFAQVRIVFALAWSFALGAEFTGAQEGLGFLMIQSERFGFLGRVIVVVLLFTIYAVIVDALLVAARRRALRWAPLHG
jgi:ABC-type nitrate/sulfonate/bicarbonate transport system permease component